MKSLTRPLARNSKPFGYLRSQRYWSRLRILQLPSSAARRSVSAKRLATQSARSKARLQAEKRFKPAAMKPQALGQHEQHLQSGDPRNQFAEPAQPDFKRGRRRFSDQCGSEHAQRRMPARRADQQGRDATDHGGAGQSPAGRPLTLCAFKIPHAARSLRVSRSITVAEYLDNRASTASPFYERGRADIGWSAIVLEWADDMRFKESRREFPA